MIAMAYIIRSISPGRAKLGVSSALNNAPQNTTIRIHANPAKTKRQNQLLKRKERRQNQSYFMHGSRCCILISSAVISTATGKPPLLCHAETYTPKEPTKKTNKT
jgi:hypothetical protein